MVAGTITFTVLFEVRVMQAPRNAVRSPLVVPTHLRCRRRFVPSCEVRPMPSNSRENYRWLPAPR